MPLKIILFKTIEKNTSRRHKFVQFFERIPIKRPTQKTDRGVGLFMGILLLQLGYP